MASHNVQLWFRGLAAAVVSSASSAITVLIVDPNDFSPAAIGGWSKLGTVVLVNALVGLALYLKQSPIPPEEPGE